MASPSSGGPLRQQRVVVVVGKCGTGKSSFIRSCMRADDHIVKPATSNAALPVTQEPAEYDSEDGQFRLIDTVGLDVRGSDLGLSLDRVQGRSVHFVVLLTLRRWQHEFQDALQKLSWAAPGANVSKWAAHGAAFDASDDFAASAHDATHKAPPALMYLKKLGALTFETVPPRPAPPPPPAAPVAAMKQPKGPPAAASHTTPDDIDFKAKMWFGVKLDALSDPQRRLYDFWIRMGWQLPKQRQMKPSHWLSLPNLALLQQKRRSGECYLKLHLLEMFGHTNFEQNDHILRKIDAIDGLRQHIDELYTRAPQQANEMGSDKYADYIEALFLDLAQRKEGQRFLVHFLSVLSS